MKALIKYFHERWEDVTEDCQYSDDDSDDDDEGPTPEHDGTGARYCDALARMGVRADVLPPYGQPGNARSPYLR